MTVGRERSVEFFHTRVEKLNDTRELLKSRALRKVAAINSAVSSLNNSTPAVGLAWNKPTVDAAELAKNRREPALSADRGGTGSGIAVVWRWRREAMVILLVSVTALALLLWEAREQRLGGCP